MIVPNGEPPSVGDDASDAPNFGNGPVQTMRVRRPQNTMISRCSGLTRLQVRFLTRNHTRAGQSDRGGYV